MKMSARDKEWQAEDDARTLTNSLEVQADKDRFKSAQKVLKKQKDQIDGVLAKIMEGKK